MNGFLRAMTILTVGMAAGAALGQAASSVPATLPATSTAPASSQAATDLPDGAVAIAGPNGADGQPIGRINGIAIRTDGKLLATAGEDGRLRLWKIDGPLAVETKVLPVPAGLVAPAPTTATSQPASTQAASQPAGPKGLLTVALSPDGKLVAAAALNGVVAWDAGTGAVAFTIETPSPRRATFVAGGKELWTYGPKDDRLFWSVKDRSLLRKEAQPSFAIPNIFLQPGSTLRTEEVIEDPFGDYLGCVYMVEGKNQYPPGLLFTFVEASTKRMVNQITIQPQCKTPGGVAAFSWPNARYLAAGGTNYGVLTLTDATSGTPKNLRGHKGVITSLAFTRDGKYLASSDSDGLVVVWPMDLVPKPAKSPDLGKAWEGLVVDDSRGIFVNVCQMVDTRDQAVQFLHDKIKPDIKVDQAEFKQILEELDSDTYTVRVKAREKLAQVAPGIWPVVRDAVKDAKSSEVRDALEAVLIKVAPPTAGQETRAVMALERIGSEEAVKLLRTFAGVADNPNLSGAAKKALERLEYLGLMPQPASQPK